MTDGLFTFGTLETVEIHRDGPDHANDPVALCPLGVLYRHQGNVYRYVQYDGQAPTDTIMEPDVVYWEHLDPLGLPAGGNLGFMVNEDEGHCSAGINGMAGICHCPSPGVEHLHFTFIQVGGVSLVPFDTPGAAPGDKVIGSGTNALASFIVLGANNTDNIFGIVIDYADPTTDKALVLLQNLMW